MLQANAAQVLKAWNIDVTPATAKSLGKVDRGSAKDVMRAALACSNGEDSLNLLAKAPKG